MTPGASDSRKVDVPLSVAVAGSTTALLLRDHRWVSYSQSP